MYFADYGSSSNPCNYQTYAGSKPFSEIETRSLSEYISGLENMLGYIAFHADAQMLLLPYSDSSEHVDNYDDLVWYSFNVLFFLIVAPVLMPCTSRII